MAEQEKKIHTWKSVLESKGLKVNLTKTEVIVSMIGEISVLQSRRKDPCGICGKKTMTNAILCR